MFIPINLPQQPKIVKKQGNLSIFEIKGYHPGYGLTIGNALRRTLLDSLPGAAIISAKIDGVNHEFATLPHVMESVVQIILSLKQIRLKMYGEGPQKMTLDVRGIRQVTAADIKTPSSIEITTPNVPIATLTHKNARLTIEFEVDSGLGYVPAEKIQKEKLAVGLMVLDAIFTPIKRVNFSVEQMRVGEHTDYDLLRLEIETDGTMTPEDALKQVSAILVDQFKIFSEFESEQKDGKSIKIAKVKKNIKDKDKETVKIEDKKTIKQDLANIKIEDLKLSTKIISVLQEAGIKTAAGLAQRKAETLVELPGIGARSLQDIKRVLGRLGLTLK
ncbi:MAG: DNA-directed RNA polymerase subunit alpha [Candidatus Portnoybacteria bacterium CG06_land_8_20_14_3_00_39_12]|uniref:DNA-directed RNA polymerase subunit alpha n=2 Tax=Candidatus Portnoyibacteriota TaxID=1817913 RepID=A0A2M8KFT6_9BACT|nr:MAG: DNA-directed RNA polymerase subunit alpha [Parcubacteria group bacterium CG1_02_40_25]PIU75517.1 MAG: DNA-directed RNA polymerase subunit alpha [Candidatus Portnoybacteria bacterium CG06_land_8_20_14_3_00_39_12]PJE58774.1 MAG: DNA-directed RNA polymerase subunit alpha [Candidatus Portnoybacteria bacterium CG10_big_fil_rev_8_21_14_0_10_40_22]